MRHIPKSHTHVPYSFKRFLVAWYHVDRNPRTPFNSAIEWSKLSDDPKRAFWPKKELWQALVKSQGGICSYCQRKLDPEQVEIEHFLAKAQFPSNVFDFENLYAACKGFKNVTAKMDKSVCSFAKDSPRHIILHSFLKDPDCAQWFVYKRDGRIEAIAKELDKNTRHLIALSAAAESAILALNLNHPVLVAERRRATDFALKELRLKGLAKTQRKELLKRLDTPPYPGFVETYKQIVRPL